MAEIWLTEIFLLLTEDAHSFQYGIYWSHCPDIELVSGVGPPAVDPSLPLLCLFSALHLLLGTETRPFHYFVNIILTLLLLNL